MSERRSQAQNVLLERYAREAIAFSKNKARGHCGIVLHVVIQLFSVFVRLIVIVVPAIDFTTRIVRGVVPGANKKVSSSGGPHWSPLFVHAIRTAIVRENCPLK